MLLSIVTICFNEEDNIQSTIESILMQDSGDYEYIICDGGSNDRTMEIINSYTKKIKEKGINLVVSSREDGGIYYGMNDGINLASGDYVIFINAGDKLYNKETVSNIIECIKKNKEIDVYYGDCILVERNIEKFRLCNDEGLLKDMTLCHPSVLVKLSLMKQIGFDTSLRLAADYDLLLHLKMLGSTFRYISIPLSYCFAGGLSTTNFRKSFSERFIIWDQYGIEYDKDKEMKKCKKEENVLLIKQHIPKTIWNIWNIRIKKRKLHKVDEYI